MAHVAEHVDAEGHVSILDPRFGQIDSRLGYLLRSADLQHLRIFRDLLREIGLTPGRATALAFVRANPASSQADLGRALDVNRASTMEIVNALGALGAMERRPGRDRRSNILALTAQGEALCDAFIEASHEMDRIITADLDEDEKRQLVALLLRVRSSMSNHLK